jgi:biopolymer transport protein ExbD
MQIYTQKRRRQDVPLIPMIDILAILLIFFIVTTTFKKKKSRLQIELPATTTLVSSEDTLERTAVSISPEGTIYFGDDEVGMEDLEERLRDFAARGLGAENLELKADAGSPLGKLVEVWDVLTRSGFSINEVPARIRRQQ